VWGNNQFGQCNVPPALGQVIQVECGWAHTAVVTMERTVVVWGAGSADNADPNWGQRLVPTGLQGVGSISTKGCHIMALLLDGTVRCWGRNQERQCDAPPLTGVVKIAAGSDHSMALTANGELRSWGWDYYRQVTDQPEAERFQSIAACMYGSIGLTMDGRVLQWGYAMGPPPSGLQCVESITAGGFHAFAYRGTDSDGDGVCDSRDNCPSIVNPDQADCDHDGAGDACEIANGSTSDLNHNGTPDTCECLGDLLADGRIDGADLGAVLSYWGPASSSPTSQACDIDKNGVVNGADLGLLLSNWGPCSN
jgi:hypothetical protein